MKLKKKKKIEKKLIHLLILINKLHKLLTFVFIALSLLLIMNVTIKKLLNILMIN